MVRGFNVFGGRPSDLLRLAGAHFACVVITLISTSAQADNSFLLRKHTFHAPKTNVEAPDKSDALFGERVKMIAQVRPIDPKNSSRGIFKYKAKYRRPIGDNPTVIMIPGGPGETIMQNATHGYYGYPDEFGVILTDPRGVGANYSEHFTPSDLTSENVADDILAVIKSQKLSNYVVFGGSYGTVVATIVGAKFRALGLPPPIAVLLQGTLGKALSPDVDESRKGYASEFLKTLLSLKPDIRDKFQENTAKLILEKRLSPTDLGRLFEATLMMGRVDGRNVTETIEEALSDKSKFSDSSDPVPISFGDDGKDPNGYRVFYHTVACREIFPKLDSYGYVYLTYSVQHAGNDCADVMPDDRNLFDSARWQIQAPIIYLQGQDDPATPVEGMRYHFENQTNVIKIPVIVPKAGHMPLANELSGCATAFWRSLTPTNVIQLNPVVESFAKCMPASE